MHTCHRACIHVTGGYSKSLHIYISINQSRATFYSQPLQKNIACNKLRRLLGKMTLINDETDKPGTVENAVNFSINVSDIPPTPVQHAEFTVTCQPRSRRSSRQQRLISDKDGHNLQLVSDSLQQLKCYSRESNSKMMAICDSVKISEAKKSSLAARQQGGGESSVYDVTSSICEPKYSHLDRMTLLKGFIRQFSILFFIFIVLVFALLCALKIIQPQLLIQYSSKPMMFLFLLKKILVKSNYLHNVRKKIANVL